MDKIKSKLDKWFKTRSILLQEKDTKKRKDIYEVVCFRIGSKTHLYNTSHDLV